MNNTKKMALVTVDFEMLFTGSVLAVSEEAIAVIKTDINGSGLFKIYFDTVFDNQTYMKTISLYTKENTVRIGCIGPSGYTQSFRQKKFDSGIFMRTGEYFCLKNYTQTLDFAVTDNGGIIELAYELWAGDIHLGFYRYDIFVR